MIEQLDILKYQSAKVADVNLSKPSKKTVDSVERLVAKLDEYSTGFDEVPFEHADQINESLELFIKNRKQKAKLAVIFSVPRRLRALIAGLAVSPPSDGPPLIFSKYLAEVLKILKGYKEVIEE